MNFLHLELAASGVVIVVAAVSLARHPALRTAYHAVSGAGAMIAGLALWLWLAGASLSFATDGKAIDLPSEKSAAAAPTSDSDVQITDSNVIIPPGRPSWVEAMPVRKGDEQWTAVNSGPYARRGDCVKALDAQIQLALDDYIAEYLGSPLAPKLLGYSAGDARRRLLHDTYEETITVSVGPMQQLHAKLDFSSDFRAEIERRWSQWRAASRIGQVGLGFAAILGLLTTSAGFFRLDHATRGYYTGRLQFLAAGVILGLGAAGVLVARLIPWI